MKEIMISYKFKFDAGESELIGRKRYFKIEFGKSRRYSPNSGNRTKTSTTRTKS